MKVTYNYTLKISTTDWTNYKSPEVRDRLILHDLTYMYNLKKKKNQTCKSREKNGSYQGLGGRIGKISVKGYKISNRRNVQEIYNTIW